MKTDWLEIAKECPVLKGLSPKDLEALMKNINLQIRTFRKDEIIASQGDEVRSLMILLAGSVRGEMTDFSGRMIRIEDVQAPRPLAEAFIFGRENRYPVEVIANEEVRILLIFKEDLLRLLSLSPVIQINYLNLISTKAQFLTHKIKFLSFKTIREKMAYYILQLKPQEDGNLYFPSTQLAMANLFGVARPSVARVLKDMEDEGIIRTKSKLVEILDHDALLELMKE